MASDTMKNSISCFSADDGSVIWEQPWSAHGNISFSRSGAFVALGGSYGGSVYSVSHGFVVCHVRAVRAGAIDSVVDLPMVQQVGVCDGRFVLAYPSGLYECYDYEIGLGSNYRWSYRAPRELLPRERYMCVSNDGRWLFIHTSSGFQCLDCETGSVVTGSAWVSFSSKCIRRLVYVGVPLDVSECPV